MRWIAIAVGTLAAACFIYAFRLYLVMDAFASGPDYDRHVTVVMGEFEADGSGIFFPVVLLVVSGVFLAWFAIRLWRNR